MRIYVQNFSDSTTNWKSNWTHENPTHPSLTFTNAAAAAVATAAALGHKIRKVQATKVLLLLFRYVDSFADAHSTRRENSNNYPAEYDCLLTVMS